LQGISLTITTKPIGRSSKDFLLLYSQKFLEVPIIVYFFGLVTLLIAFLLNMTVFGKHVYAVGGNLTVAELSGIPVKKIRYGVYGICSLLAAVTGLLWLMRMGVGDPVIGKELELNAIIAVVIGGTSLFGGRGTVTGVIGGVLLLTFTDNLLVVLGVNQFVSGLVKGVIFVAAVALYKPTESFQRATA
ncbi:MAG: ABC transporter permease, partial [Deltaproteobacteria bacterium]